MGSVRGEAGVGVCITTNDYGLDEKDDLPPLPIFSRT